ncbi:DUF5615 family PIN-like protein [Halobacteria archaeon AArc-m2/3/4]|uniref:DUF5615 family PIN-like protein n=1 Tax=Natronoglomus mannanivorans TaxID=2979990 RepID=A0AAP3E3H1_9EURY|nr:DUF5615 family PIN-like protein [Halobacteria archaeon AArc-xg1-1]MCU4972151.1 DUF5615 family PIN-like protein [Halobacteria archaeon AArc-m2/3/4]
MTGSFLTDEHVPSVFITALSSAGYDVVTVRSVLEAGADDSDVLEYAAGNGLVLITNDRSDFAEAVSAERSHRGIIIYTDRNFLNDAPETAVQTIDRALSHYPPSELENEIIWLEQWRCDQ